jgi:hypothetical protein
MTEAVDPLTIALTGHLPFHLILAAILTWPTAVGLLSLYKRAVRRSMRAAASVPGSSVSAAPPLETGAGSAIGNQPRPHSVLYNLPLTQTTPEAGALFSLLLARPRRAALAYSAGGVAYALIMAVAQLRADGLELLPVRFLFQFWVSLWPLVFTIGVAAAASFGRARLTAAYFIVLFAIAGAGMPSSPDLSWPDVVLSWALNNLPPTVLLAAYLSRGIRAVGPLVLTFMLFALIGADIAVSLPGSDERYLRALIDVTAPLGLGGTGTFVMLLVLGFLMFAGVGWMALAWIRSRYQAKQISDESVTIDAIWIMFAIAHSVNLVFGHPLWALAGIAALAAYKAFVRIGFRWAARGSDLSVHTPALLVLRSFSIGKDGERLFDIIDSFWRRIGTIDMITGIDLAHRTIEPHEFLDFISGKLARRFIDGSAVMEQRFRERDTRPDQDLRFRVNDFFCYDDTWKMVLSRLVRESDAVLMDLRGFSRQNAGCVFEIRELARMIPLERVVFVIDRRTDENLLAEMLGECRAGVYRLDGLSGRRVRPLLQALASASAPMSVTTAQWEPVC